MKGQLFIVSAPSGAGKTSLVKALLEQLTKVAVSVSHTTRQPRPGEVDGKDYHFVAQSVFDHLVKDNIFLEHAHVFDRSYGTSAEEVNRKIAEGLDVILEIDWQGAEQVKKQRPEAVTVFILPPSVEALESRLNGRGQDSAEIVARRMRDARSEMSHVHEFDYVIINDDFEIALSELIAIFVAERQRYARQQNAISEIVSD